MSYSSSVDNSIISRNELLFLHRYPCVAYRLLNVTSRVSKEVDAIFPHGVGSPGGFYAPKLAWIPDVVKERKMTN